MVVVTCGWSEGLIVTFVLLDTQASVAKLDARPTGDQEVVLPFADSRRAVDSVWRKNVHNIG